MKLSSKKILSIAIASFLSTVAYAEDTTASVTQIGNYHSATIVQGANNIATVLQTGNDNTAVIDQKQNVNGLNNPGSLSNIAEIEQTDNWNTSSVNQNMNNTASVSQSGMGTYTQHNRVLINQYGEGAFATATQLGAENNTINISQGFESDGSGFINTAVAIQDGANNVANITQQP